VVAVEGDGFLGVPGTWALGRPVVQVVHAAEVAAGGRFVLAGRTQQGEVDVRSFELVDAQDQVRAAAEVSVASSADGGSTWAGRWTTPPPPVSGGSPS
jgi:hypothetical protein